MTITAGTFAPATLAVEVPTVTYEFRVVSADDAAPSLGQVLRETWRQTLAYIAIGMVAAQFLVLPLVQQREQVAAARELKSQFGIAAGAIGHSDLSPLPTEPAALGAAIATLSVPALGLEQVVVEGASGTQTLRGPGHLAGTAGIGERGTAIVAGHRAAAGATFSALGALKVGAVIKTVTVAGPMTYRVTELRSSLPGLKDSTGNKSRLVLATSTPAGLAFGDLVVVAESTAPAYPSTPQNRLDSRGLRSVDLAGAVLLIVCGVLLMLFITLARFWLRARLMDTLIVWTVAAPVVLLLGLLVARGLSAVLPATL